MERIAGGPWGANCYAVSSVGSAVIIDPGAEAGEILNALAVRSLEITGLVATHGHFDHVGAAAALTEATGLPLWISAADTRILAAGNLHSLATGHGRPVARPALTSDLDTCAGNLRFGTIEFTVISTPGHTPGSRCLLLGNALFTGDTLMARGAVDSPLPGADLGRLRVSLEDLAEDLDHDSIVVYPGHGPSCVLGDALTAAAAAWPASGGPG